MEKTGEEMEGAHTDLDQLASEQLLQQMNTIK